MKSDLLENLRRGERLQPGQQLLLITRLSIPGILAQVSSIIMQYIDASMVGRLGAKDSASIGLVSSSTWLAGCLCVALSTGFTVQVAHQIGAGNKKKARGIVRQGLACALFFSAVLLVVAVAISGRLPIWLGGEPDICKNASVYFLVYGLFLPVRQLNHMASGMLQCSGNMKVPSVLQILMCLLDVILNLLLIFPSRNWQVGGLSLHVPGAGLGVAGAALGTVAAETIVAGMMLYFLLVRSEPLHLIKGERLVFVPGDLKNAVRIALPVAAEQTVMCSAQVASTKIVSPLGSIAIAANSFAVTAESLCYMPGFGIASAATTLIGQSIGAKRTDLTRRFGWLTTGYGMAVMAGMGVLMYFSAPFMIGFLTPDPAIRELGTEVLRVEAFAEPLYAASIVASGVFRGAGDTLIPCCINFFSMWAVRLPLAAFLAPRLGLRGVWVAMCIELSIRGVLFLLRLARKNWGD